MERFLFIYNLLAALSDGRLFRSLFSTLLRVLSVALIIYLIGDTIERWQEIYYGNEITTLFIGEMIRILSGYAVIHLMLLRAAEIHTLSNPLYTLSEVITVIIRLSGELLFIITLSITITTTLQLLGLNVQLLIPELAKIISPLLEHKSSLWIGVAGTGLSLLFLVAGHFASELLEMILRLSRNSEPR